MSKMEVIQQCLNLAPVPCLSAAFGLFKSIWDVVQLVGSYKFQLKELARSIALLLSRLNHQYQRQEPLETPTLNALSNFGSLLTEILELVTRQNGYGFFKLLFVKDDMQKAIDSYHRRITDAFRIFQVSALLDIQSLQQESKRARNDDHQEIIQKLRQIESNQNLLKEELKGQTKDPMVTMAALQKRLHDRQGNEAELIFFSNSLNYIREKTGLSLEYESWMITSLEVEFGRVISKGGFGIVYQGKWKGADVALKVLKNKEGITPHETDLRREIKTWSILHHPNILQFIGVSVLDDEPFIVMPLVQHGNVRNYLDKNPNCNRIEIILQISIGISYLHSKNVIHGDLKAANVLIDDGGKPLLCDFGLARIKENVDSRSSNQSTSSARGSLNWMAPERLEGHRLRKPCDIYSFAMTMYEIHCNSNPFGALPPNDFREVVAVRNKRPERPDDDEAPQLTEDGWKLMTECWAPEPLHRPDAESARKELERMKMSTVNSGGQRRRSHTPHYSGMPPLPETNYEYSSMIPSRRQTAENTRPITQRPAPNRTQTHHTYYQNHVERSQSLPESAHHTPPIIQSGYHSEPVEIEESFANLGLLNQPSSPPDRRRVPNPSYENNNNVIYASQEERYATQYGPPFQSYISPPHSSPTQSTTSPPAIHSSYSYPGSGSYVPNPHTPQGNMASQSSFTIPSNPVNYAPVRGYTISPTMNASGGYPSYSSDPYAPRPPPTPPNSIQSRSLTLPMPNQYDRARSPDPAFPLPYYHG